MWDLVPWAGIELGPPELGAWSLNHCATREVPWVENSVLNHFLVLCCIFWLFFFFWLYCTACGILVPRPGMEPVPPAVEARSPNHWTAREFPLLAFNLPLRSLLPFWFLILCIKPIFHSPWTLTPLYYLFFVSSVLKFHHAVSWCGFIFVHYAGRLLGHVILQIHTLQFWGFFSPYYCFNFLFSVFSGLSF